MEIELKELLRYILVFFYVAYYVFSLFLALLLCQPGLLPFLYNSYCVGFFFFIVSSDVSLPHHISEMAMVSLPSYRPL